MYLTSDATRVVSGFYGQHYGDDEGSWRVEDIYDFIQKQKVPLKNLNVEQLAANNLAPSEHEIADELPGSPEFIKRANEADLSYPILAVQYHDGIWICDGVHRLWKARDEGKKTIPCYLINRNQLRQITKTKD